ncbi:ankyrin repeat protein, partial [Aspergillus sp. HF37]
MAEKEDTGLAYFYFDFNDGYKQTLEGLLLSITLQLASQQQNRPEEFELFCDRFRSGQQRPGVKDILNVLLAIVRHFQIVYLIMDALDECCEQEGVLDLIADLVQASPSINVLVTSRDSTDIRIALGNVLTNVVSASLDGISLDIRTYVRNSLSRDPKLRARPNHVKSEIESALASGAHGMFRWVECQLESLRSCLTPASVRKTLNSMPKTLEKTYDMILARINPDYQGQVYMILQWLAFCVRPLRLPEVAEVLVLKPGTSTLSEQDRLFCDCDVATIGSGLIRISDVNEVRLAHYSVKEYLMSDQRKSMPSPSFHIAEIPTNCYIAHSCVTYLLLQSQFGSPSPDSFLKLPLLDYAAAHWHDHARIALRAGDHSEHEIHTKDFVDCTIQLLDESRGLAYLNWLRMSDPDDWNRRDLSKGECNVPRSLYYMSFLGLYDMAKKLVDRGDDVNARGGQFGSALQAAAFRNHCDIIRLLLQNGAEVKVQGGLHSTALNAAAVNGSKAAFRILLEQQGQKEITGSTLVAAAASGAMEIVNMLLDNGEDVNFQGEDPENHTSILAGNAITAASFQGHEHI